MSLDGMVSHSILASHLVHSGLQIIIGSGNAYENVLPMAKLGLAVSLGSATSSFWPVYYTHEQIRTFDKVNMLDFWRDALCHWQVRSVWVHVLCGCQSVYPLLIIQTLPLSRTPSSDLVKPTLIPPLTVP